jgi:16S rRNA (guanine527-N7)-methyltransferase
MSTSASLGEIVSRELDGIVQLTPDQIGMLEFHYRLLLQWNRKMNLTTVTAVPDAAVRHYCESIFLAKHLTSGSVVDIGSGAGFPGIPAAIVRGDCQIYLVESNQRKAVFLKEASRGLANVSVLPVRAQAITDRIYDWLIARAVDPSALLDLRLASRYALLLGRTDAERIVGAELIPLPWGGQRALLLGKFV